MIGSPFWNRMPVTGSQSHGLLSPLHLSPPPRARNGGEERKKVTVERENGSMKGRNESSIPGSPATTVSHLHFHSYRGRFLLFLFLFGP